MSPSVLIHIPTLVWLLTPSLTLLHFLITRIIDPMAEIIGLCTVNTVLMITKMFDRRRSNNQTEKIISCPSPHHWVISYQNQIIVYKVKNPYHLWMTLKIWPPLRFSETYFGISPYIELGPLLRKIFSKVKWWVKVFLVWYQFYVSVNLKSCTVVKYWLRRVPVIVVFLLTCANQFPGLKSVKSLEINSKFGWHLIQARIAGVRTLHVN